MSDEALTPDVTDNNLISWDLFTSTLDTELLELERCVSTAASAELAGRVLASERFGSRQHHDVMHSHNLRRGEFRRVVSQRPDEVWFSAKQLQIAGNVLAGQSAESGMRAA